MRVRFQADADLDARIIRALKRRQPEVDMQTAAEAGLPGLADPDVLRVAADSRRVLVTHDQRTMPRHFAQFIAGRTSAGVIVVPKSISLGIAVEELLRIWAASQAEEWHNRLAGSTRFRCVSIFVRIGHAWTATILLGQVPLQITGIVKNPDDIDHRVVAAAVD